MFDVCQGTFNTLDIHFEIMEIDTRGQFAIIEMITCEHRNFMWNDKEIELFLTSFFFSKLFLRLRVSYRWWHWQNMYFSIFAKWTIINKKHLSDLFGFHMFLTQSPKFNIFIAITMKMNFDLWKLGEYLWVNVLVAVIFLPFCWEFRWFDVLSKSMIFVSLCCHASCFRLGRWNLTNWRNSH